MSPNLHPTTSSHLCLSCQWQHLVDHITRMMWKHFSIMFHLWNILILMQLRKHNILSENQIFFPPVFPLIKFIFVLSIYTIIWSMETQQGFLPLPVNIFILHSVILECLYEFYSHSVKVVHMLGHGNMYT